MKPQADSEAVLTDRLADSGGYLCHRVRVDVFTLQDAAVAAQDDVTAHGYAGGAR